jgi:hypothetical protein
MTIRKGTGSGAPRIRVRRARPARTAPLRHWPGALRQPDSWQPDGPLATDSGIGAESRRANGAIDGVKLGYSVIEEHMRRAESVERQYRSKRAKEPTGGGPDLQDTVARVFRSVADLVPLVGQIINSASAAGFNQTVALGSPLAAANHPDRRGFLEANSAVEIELSSPQPVKATLDLRPGADRLALVTTGLYAPGIDKPVVKGIEFAKAAKGKKASLRIRVPRMTAGAICSGLLLERESGEPQGVLTVRVAK